MHQALPQSAAEKTLVDLNAKVAEAEKSRDAEFFKATLSDGLTFRRADGRVVRKKEFLWDLVQPENAYEYLESEEIRAEVLGPVAIVTLRVRAKGQRGPNPFEGTYRNVRLFVKNEAGDAWQCAVWFNVRE